MKSTSKTQISMFAFLVCLLTASASSQDTPLYQTLAEQDLYLKGIAKPIRLVELSARVEGIIAEVLVREGEQVDAQQVLAFIQDAEAKASVKIARIEAEQTGEIDRAELDWKIENQRYQRLMSVVSNNATSELELWEKAAIRDQKKAISTVAKEQKKLAEARLEKAITEWRKHQIVSPFKGQVIEIHKKAGTQPKNSEKVITIADLSRLEVVMHLPIKLFRKHKPGDQIKLIAEAPVSKELTATVQSVSPLINSTSETFRCVLVIDNANRLLPAGFLVSAKSE